MWCRFFDFLVYMKRLLCFLLLIFLLPVNVLAAECVERLDSDGYGCQECVLGDFAADAMRCVCGTEIALCASGDLGITLPAGALTRADFENSFPTDSTIVVTTISGEDLRALLEASLSGITLNEKEEIDKQLSASPDFFCISGFTFSYDASAPVGERVYNWEYDEREFTLAVSSAYQEGTPVDTLARICWDYAECEGTIEAPEGDRIQVLGAHTNSIVGHFISREAILLLTLVILAYGAFRVLHKRNTEDDF